MDNINFSSKMTKIISMFAIVFVAYNVVLFVLCGFSGHGAAFWISYVFMVIAFADVAAIEYLLKGRSVLPKDWLLGYPILRHAAIYIIFEFILSATFIVGDYYKWKGTIAFAIQMISLAVHLVFVISCFLAKEMIEDVQEKVNISTTDMRLLQSEVEMIAEKTADTDVKNTFRNLAEQIRYSDPVSNEYLSALEREILTHVTNASVCVETNDREGALEGCKKASLLLIERNKKCKALK